MLPDIIYGLPNATSCFKVVSMLDLKLLNVAMWPCGPLVTAPKESKLKLLESIFDDHCCSG